MRLSPRVLSLGLAALLALAGLLACTCQETPPAAPPAEPAPPTQAGAPAPPPDDGTPLAPPPVDPEKPETWLGETAAQIPTSPEVFRMGPDGAGSFVACMSEEELRRMPGLRLCPETSPNAPERCYTPQQESRRENLPLELWVRDEVLSRAVARHPLYQSPHGIGVGASLELLRVAYKAPHFLRGDAGEWIAAVSPLNTQFVLDDRTAESATDLSLEARVVRVETVFDCREPK